VRVIHSVDAPTHTGPVPQAVEAGDFGRPREAVRSMMEVVAYRERPS
jgi:hypothetical protein